MSSACIAAISFVIVAGIIILLTGCAANGVALRSPSPNNPSTATSSYIETRSNEIHFSCSFVEFDERGDFLDFAQHKACTDKIEELGPKTLTVIYCHGWKNNAQSADVLEFNSFLGKLAQSKDVKDAGIRVHGVYLGWRGNLFRPYIDEKSREYQETRTWYGAPIVDKAHHRTWFFPGVIPETFSYWSRKGAAEDHVSGLPIARAIFTYASAAKGYGHCTGNPVIVIGHSFGALMLEQSLGQAMTGALVLNWWGENVGKKSPLPPLPFDLVLFVNSAAPSIYAKEMRDFLAADRAALGREASTLQDAPVIVSVTSTADWATGKIHPIGNMFAPFASSLKRNYTSGIFGNSRVDPATMSVTPRHAAIRQSRFYTRTPGHQPYLINHWIVRQPESVPPVDRDEAAVFGANLSGNGLPPDEFLTSRSRYPAARWKISDRPPPPEEPVKLDHLDLSMRRSNYWIVSCGKEIINSHNDIWSTNAMEMYAAIFRAVASRRGPVKNNQAVIEQLASKPAATN